LKDLEKLLEEAKGSKRKDQEVRFGGGTIFLATGDGRGR